MSLKQFLVVGRSFIGIRDTKSPYELRKENLLPRFGEAPRGSREKRGTEQPMVQADWIEQQKVGSEPESASEVTELAREEAQSLGTVAPVQVAKVEGATSAESGSPFSAPVPSVVRRSKSGRAVSARRHRGWLNLLTFGLLGRGKEQQPLVQAELSLDRIKVVRNDLTDSDLELVIRKKKKKVSPEEAQAGVEPRPPQRWSRLTARLFEMGQER